MGWGEGGGRVSLLKNTSFTWRQFSHLSYGLNTKMCWKMITQNCEKYKFSNLDVKCLDAAGELKTWDFKIRLSVLELFHVYRRTDIQTDRADQF